MSVSSTRFGTAAALVIMAACTRPGVVLYQGLPVQPRDARIDIEGRLCVVGGRDAMGVLGKVPACPRTVRLPPGTHRLLVNEGGTSGFWFAISANVRAGGRYRVRPDGQLIVHDLSECGLVDDSEVTVPERIMLVDAEGDVLALGAPNVEEEELREFERGEGSERCRGLSP